MFKKHAASQFTGIDFVIKIVAVWGYAVLCGNPASIVRASLFYSFIVCMRRIRVHLSTQECLSIIYLACAFYDPWVAFDLGMLLSIAGVVGLGCAHEFRTNEFGPLCLKRLKFDSTDSLDSGMFGLGRRRAKWLGILVGYISSSLATVLLTQAFVFSDIGRTAEFPMLSNLIICWFVAIVQLPIMVLCCTGLALDVELLLIWASDLGGLIYYGVSTIDSWWGQIVNHPGLSICEALSFVVGVVICVTAVKSNTRRLLLLCLIYLTKQSIQDALVTASDTAPLQSDVHFISVGQGDCVFIRTPDNKAILIDVAPGHSNRETSKTRIKPLMLRYNIDVIDLVILTHPDHDHIGGMLELINNTSIKEVWLGGRPPDNPMITQIKKHLRDQNIPIRLKSDIQLPCQFGNFKIQILNPIFPNGVYNAEELGQNDNSLIVEMSVFGKRLLFPGDIEFYGESYLRSSRRIRPVDILLAPHHGSSTSSTPQFIRMTQPEHVIFSTGFLNNFGFPKRNVVKRYKDSNAELWSSACHGTLHFEINTDGIINVNTHTTERIRNVNYACQKLNRLEGD